MGGKRDFFFTFSFSSLKTYIMTKYPSLNNLDPIALGKAKIVCNFCLSECNRANEIWGSVMFQI